MTGLTHHLARRITRVLAAALLPLLAACATAPAPDRPQVAPATRYTADVLQLEQPAQAPGAQRIALGEELDHDWWRLFGSPAINDVVRKAIAGNRNVAAAAAGLQQARELATAQVESDGPQANLTAGAGRQKYGKQFFGSLPAIPPFSYFSLGADISDTVDFGDTATQRIAQRRALADYGQQQLRAAWLSVSGDAVAQFVAAAGARSQLATLDTLVQQDRQYVDLLGQSIAAGAASQIDLAEAEARLADDQARVPALRQQLAVARTALAVLQGEPPANATDAPLDLDGLSLPHRLPVALPSEVAHRRPDILAAESQLQAAVAAVGIAHAAFYPHLTLTASTGLQATDISELFDRSSGVFGLTGSFVAPLLDRRALQANERANVAAMHASAARYEQTVLQAFGDVSNALQALEQDAARLDAVAHSGAAESRRAQLLRTARDQGSGGILPLLEATRKQQLAELDVQQARTQQLLDTVRLFVALGGSKPD